MLKTLTTIYRNREVTLECTHKKIFPPPQMYGSTPEDIDTLWRQGVIDQNQYQHLKVWRDNCNLMVMGPRCLDCSLALKQNPRPGRPNVIRTEPWLPVKEKMRWEDMKTGKLAPAATLTLKVTPGLIAEGVPDPERVTTETVGFMKKGTPVPVAVVEPEDTMGDAPDELSNEEVEEEDTEPEKRTLLDALQNPDDFLAENAESGEEGLGDDILDALADD